MHTSIINNVLLHQFSREIDGTAARWSYSDWLPAQRWSICQFGVAQNHRKDTRGQRIRWHSTRHIHYSRWKCCATRWNCKPIALLQMRMPKLGFHVWYIFVIFIFVGSWKREESTVTRDIRRRYIGFATTWTRTTPRKTSTHFKGTERTRSQCERWIGARRVLKRNWWQNNQLKITIEKEFIVEREMYLRKLN